MSSTNSLKAGKLALDGTYVRHKNCQCERQAIAKACQTMNETPCGTGCPVMPVCSKSKISQPNYFSSRRIHKGKDPNLQHCHTVRKMHCESVPYSYSFHLDSISFLIFHLQTEYSKGRDKGGWSNHFFNLIQPFAF